MSKSDYLILFREVFETTRKMSDQQFGILIRAAHNYRFLSERYMGDDARIDQAFETLANQIDREQEGRMRKAKAAEKRWEKDSEECTPMQNYADQCTAMQDDAMDAPIQSNPVQSNPDQSIPIQSKATQKEFTGEKKGRGNKGAAAPASAEYKKSFGKFGWVKLSQPEYDALRKKLGPEELERCIRYLDESAQSNGNKNKWKDFGLVIQRCSREGWGFPPGKGSTGAAKYSDAELNEIKEAIRKMEAEECPYGTII